MAFVDTATLCLEPWNSIIIIVHVKKLVLRSLRMKFRDVIKRKLDELRKQYIQEKCFNVIEMYQCDWCTRQIFLLTIICAKFRPIKCLSETKDFWRISNLEVYLVMFKVILKYPRISEKAFANFPPIFRNNIVGRDDIGPFMKEYAEKEGLLIQPKKMLISIYFLENGTIITPLLLCYLHLGLVCKNIYHFVQYTPLKCFKNFVQYAVNARRERGENPNFSVVAEAMKLLANSSYGHQILDRSRNTVIKYLSDGKTHEAINNKMFKRLG